MDIRKIVVWTVLAWYVLAWTMGSVGHAGQTGYNPTADSYGFNTYTFSTLPATQPGSGNGNMIECTNCTLTNPPLSGPTLTTPATCLWSGGGGGNWDCTSRSASAVCTDLGTVTTDQTFNFPGVSCYKVSTATTGLTYHIHSTTNVTTNQQIEIDSYITAGIGAGPVWAADAGSKWLGGTPPTSSNINGYIDIIFMKWNGTIWIETGESIGAH